MSLSSPSNNSMHASGTRRGRSRYTPYAPRQRSFAAISTLIPHTAQPSPPTNADGTWRDLCLRVVGSKFPGFKPRNDFELYTLATTKYIGDHSGLGPWLDAKLAKSIQDVGSLESVMEKTRNILALSTDNITGLKPVCAGNGVLQRAIPASNYSIRLFPGCLVAREYCLDFVDTRTGVAVNSPFDFELVAVPNNLSVRGLGRPIGRVDTLQEMFGLSKEQILPGQETYVLMDGQTYLLRRRGHKDVRFTVPVRSHPGLSTPDMTLMSYRSPPPSLYDARSGVLLL